MTPTLTISRLTKRFGDVEALKAVSLTLEAGRRAALLGHNGAGKSTFMKLLSGESEPQKGTVNRPDKLGVISQNQFAFDEFRVIDTVIMGNKRLWSALTERETLYEKADLLEYLKSL